ncbi:MAG: glycosyltransferase, partial [Candidatus Eiseniibacteriota bacterium]
MNPPQPDVPPPQTTNSTSSAPPGVRSPLKVFFGTIGPGMPGGLYISESAFHAACVRTGEVEPVHISFGRQSPSEGPVRMAIRQLFDLLAYAVRVLVERPDLVHLNTAFDRRALGRDIGFVWISSLLRQPLYLKFHGSDAELLSSESRLWRWMSREVIHRADAIGVLSSEERENFVRAGYEGRKFHVVKNVVDWRRFREGGWPRPQPQQLLFIARFIPAKGLLDVIRALKILSDQGRT